MRLFVISTLLIALSGCAGLSERDQRVLGGAVIGGAAGNILGNGSTGATVGGAILGGVIGNEVDRRDKAKEAERIRQDRWNSCMRYNSRRYCERNLGY